MKKILTIVLMMALPGCSMVSNRIQPALAPAANVGSSITCQGCKLEWERAQIWIVKHSKWKIQISSDVLIETFNPRGYDPSYSFTITKEPAGSGTYIIRMDLVCGNPYGCDPKPLDVKNAFYYYLKTGQDLLEGQSNLSAIR